MATSDLIADFIMQMLDSDGGMTELQRATLASRFNCVPSQINYVISTRFSPERGYNVESRRGGGGYIRITRVRSTPRQLIMHTINSVGERLDLRTAAAFTANLLNEEAVDEKTAGLIMTAVGNNALRPLDPDKRDEARASIYKYMLLYTISD